MIIKIGEKLTKEIVSKPENVCKIFNEILNTENEVDRDKEHFWVMGLTARNSVKYIELVSLGILNASIVHPRETFRTAIMQGISSLILCHNHPSGDTMPSDDDNKLTKRLKDAGKILGIELLDHMIISDNSSYSFSSNHNIFEG